jgi:hypothetical protein
MLTSAVRVYIQECYKASKRLHTRIVAYSCDIPAVSLQIYERNYLYQTFYYGALKMLHVSVV